ncbi:MAG TPA: hypothetical protein VH561_07725 [Micromonosporaceae bacterium]|jgi:hypothetical protein
MTTPVPTGSRPEGPPSTEEVLLRLAGVVVASAAAFVLAVVGAFLTPLRVGTVLVPVSLVLVVAGLVAIMWFTRAVTARAGFALIPGGVWLIVSLALSVRTHEGDLVLVQQDWVALVYLLLGTVTIGVLAYRMTMRRR